LIHEGRTSSGIAFLNSSTVSRNEKDVFAIEEYVVAGMWNCGGLKKKFHISS
jgi:hypothetical protein